MNDQKLTVEKQIHNLENALEETRVTINYVNDRIDVIEQLLIATNTTEPSKMLEILAVMKKGLLRENHQRCLSKIQKQIQELANQ